MQAVSFSCHSADASSQGRVTTSKQTFLSFYDPTGPRRARSVLVASSGMALRSQLSCRLGSPPWVARPHLGFISSPGAESQAIRLATFESTLRDIANSFALGLMDNRGLANSLAKKIENAAVASARGDIKA